MKLVLRAMLLVTLCFGACACVSSQQAGNPPPASDNKKDGY